MAWELLGSHEVGEVPLVLPYSITGYSVIVEATSLYQKPKWIKAGFLGQHFSLPEVSAPVIGLTKSFLFGASLLNFSAVPMVPYSLEVRLVEWLPQATVSIWVES